MTSKQATGTSSRKSSGTLASEAAGGDARARAGEPSEPAARSKRSLAADSGEIVIGPGRKPAPGLYVVATPIGNLRDITLRALDVLAAADLVLCEDTRVTRRLLAQYGLRPRLAVYNDHSGEADRARVLAQLRDGATVALVSDAGTPLVSDPGYRLVAAALTAGNLVAPVPGPSAVTAALAAAGMPTDRFFFAGFLPARQAARRAALEELAGVPATLVFLESTRRLAPALADMARSLGPRPAAVMREMTKLHEERRAGALDRLAADYAESGPPKGEAVIVVAPPEAAAASEAADVDRLLRQALATMSVRDAAAAVAAAAGRPKREVYARALALARDEPG